MVDDNWWKSISEACKETRNLSCNSSNLHLPSTSHPFIFFFQEFFRKKFSDVAYPSPPISSSLCPVFSLTYWASITHTLSLSHFPSHPSSPMKSFNSDIISFWMSLATATLFCPFPPSATSSRYEGVSKFIGRTFLSLTYFLSQNFSNLS
jgi:hypothetical protein